MGFEALLLGKAVHCFGMPFYAGWGLTHDSKTCPRRQGRSPCPSWWLRR
jgi:capsular polysaccharide export protein